MKTTNDTTKWQEEAEDVAVLTDKRNLILHNDDFNTFEHVIDCLIAICKHDSVQAEQCAYLVHYSGKCAVKTGEFDQLQPMKDALADQGLSVVIE